MSAPLTSIALELLPADMRSRLEALGARGRGPFGRVQTQEIVNAHLDVLLWLRQQGASHAQLAELLQALGITTREGHPLSAATISSAISRALAASGRRNGRHLTTGQSARVHVWRATQPSQQQAATLKTGSRKAAALEAAIAETVTGGDQVLPQPCIVTTATAMSARDSPPVAVRQNVRREILLTLLDSSEDQ
jgi:hypothetical protein